MMMYIWLCRTLGLEFGSWNIRKFTGQAAGQRLGLLAEEVEPNCNYVWRPKMQCWEITVFYIFFDSVGNNTHFMVSNSVTRHYLINAQFKQYLYSVI